MEEDDVHSDWWQFVPDAQAWLRIEAGHAIPMMQRPLPLLKTHPFLFDASRKHRLVRYFARQQQDEQRRNAFVQQMWGGANPDFVLEVRRDHIVVDTIRSVERVFATPSELRKPLRVKFAGEDGIDEGGVRREFFQVLLRQLIDPEIGMFSAVQAGDTELLWINAWSYEPEIKFQLVGCIIGMAIYNDVKIDVSFPATMYSKLLRKEPTLDDLELINPGLAAGLRELLAVPSAQVRVDCFVSVLPPSLFFLCSTRSLSLLFSF